MWPQSHIPVLVSGAVRMDTRVPSELDQVILHPLSMCPFVRSSVAWWQSGIIVWGLLCITTV